MQEVLDGGGTRALHQKQSDTLAYAPQHPAAIGSRLEAPPRGLVPAPAYLSEERTGLAQVVLVGPLRPHPSLGDTLDEGPHLALVAPAWVHRQTQHQTSSEHYDQGAAGASWSQAMTGWTYETGREKALAGGEAAAVDGGLADRCFLVLVVVAAALSWAEEMFPCRRLPSGASTSSSSVSLLK